MDGGRFDAMTRTLANGRTSRRWVLRGLTASVLGLALSRLGLADAVANEAEAMARGGCRAEKKACRRDNQCCSGVCRTKKCRRAPAQRTCTIRKNFCETGFDAAGCGTTNGGDPCVCVVTASGTSFCGDFASAECVPCIGSGDCAVIAGPGAACVRAVGNCTCNDGGETFCLPPCIPDPGARERSADTDGPVPAVPAVRSLESDHKAQEVRP